MTKIVSGILKKPNGEKSNFYKIETYDNGKITVKYIDIVEHGEKKSRQLVKEYLKKLKAVKLKNN